MSRPSRPPPGPSCDICANSHSLADVQPVSRAEVKPTLAFWITHLCVRCRARWCDAA